MESKNVEGRNVTIWFPDERVANCLAEMAEELHTSTSAMVAELVTQSLPAIEKHKKQRMIPLDGVVVNL